MSVELSVQGLTKTFAGQDAAALKPLDLTVPAGSCTAVLGPSGSGKSTALRLIAGLDDPTAGSVMIDGVDVTDVPAESRGVGMVFQRPMLFPHMSVIDNIGFAYRAAGEPKRHAREKAQRYLDLVHLSDIGDRSVAAISGGQAQRVALARCLAGSPRVLLLDEPFSALDPVLQGEMHDLVREIRAELGQTVVLVTHDQREAAALADSVAVLIDGTLEHHSDVASAYTRPATLPVNRLMGGLNEIDGMLVGGVHRSAVGEHPVVTDLFDGPATLLVRHEMVATGGDVRGAVTALRPNGFRSVADVSINGTVLRVELPVGAQIGDEVGLDIPQAALHVLYRTVNGNS